jgi:hypothetical protein
MKRKLPYGKNRKRWIDFLSDEEFKSLSKTDKDNLLRFQRFSSLRESKELRIKQLKEDLKKIKEEVSDLDDKEESNFLKVQFLHNTFNCSIYISEQKRKPFSLKLNSSGGNTKTYIRKTYKGEKLKERISYNGSVNSKNLEKPKGVYFQSEEKLKKTISQLTGLNVKEINFKTIKKFIQHHYRDYVIHLMRKLGSEKFSNSSILFDDFVEWYKKEKR